MMLDQSTWVHPVTGQTVVLVGVVSCYYDGPRPEALGGRAGHETIVGGAVWD